MDRKTLEQLDFFKILDFLSSFALSEEGKKRCKELYPKSSLEEIERDFSLLKEGFRFKDIIVKETKSFLNLSGVFRFLDRGKALDEDGLWAIKDLLEKAFRYKKIFSKELPEDSILGSQARNLNWPKKSWQALNRCIGKDGEIKSDSTPELYEIRKEIASIQSQCTKKITKFLEEEKIDYLQDEYLTISSDRYVIALKSNFKGKLEGIIHDYSRSGETCYFEPIFLVELNNKLQRLRQKEKEEVKKVLEYLTSLIREEQKEIKEIYDWMVDLDVLRAKILMSIEIDGTILDIKEDGGLNLLGAKNPILLITKSYVQPIDLKLNKDQKGLIISGGNAGGKTVALKTLGLLVLMTLSGLPVPAKEGSSIPFWQKVYVLFGDEQDIIRHLSTFTAQVTYIREIWNLLDDKSLVILDEFGSGTDPTEGSALAQGLIESLLDRDVYVAVATHFPSLKAFALSDKRVRSAAVLFDPITKKPLYKLGYDQVGSSLALDIAEEYGLPKEVLEKAKYNLYKEKKDLDGLFERINRLAVEKEEELERLIKERDKLKEEREKLRKRYEEKIKEILEEVRGFIKELRDEIKKEKIEKRFALKQAQKQYKEFLDKLSSNLKESESYDLNWEDVKVGAKLFYVPWEKEAIVEEKDEKDKKIKIKVGNVRIWCDLKELSFSKEVMKKDEGVVKRISSDDEFIGWRLDIRGLRVDEAISKLSKFLDSAIYKGKREVEIIHGKGEGILKRAVHEYLDEHSDLFSYTLAPETRGGDGVTLVKIKENES